ncbi:MAG: GTP-binding protein [Candidatus Auribacterota bacterium]|jgi:sulfate adenylyltransferase large subunit|nr:GTP-binding protein [Candidatus Auribacterota bacterium]
MNDSDVLSFVIVGHVDHGKSTLIGRLFYDTGCLPEEKLVEIEQASKQLGRPVEFGFVMDHLREERDQGITIDTSQAFLKTSKRKYVIIDAPGHVEFMKNMVTGASQAQAALLIVDAQEGVRPQTKRHAHILSLLGVGQVVVLINKMDLVSYDKSVYERLKQELGDFLATLNINPSQYIPISASYGDQVARRSASMPWYSGLTVLECLDTLTKKESLEGCPLLMPIQDVYKINSKRIYAGRVAAGTIYAGMEIKVMPQEQLASVKSIEKFLESPIQAVAGESIGITTTEAIFAERGHVICTDGHEPSYTTRIKANVFWMSKQPYVKGGRLILKCSTQEVFATIQTICRRIDSATLEIIAEDADKLKNLDVAEVIITVEKPVCIAPFNDVEEMGRFVLIRDNDVCAGGIVIEPLPDPDIRVR